MNPWTLGALIFVLAFRTKEGRVISKKAMRAGVAASISAKNSALELIESAKESYAEILAEVHDEIQEENLSAGASKKTARASKATKTPESASSFE